MTGIRKSPDTMPSPEGMADCERRSPGQIAYEADVQAQPTYNDGTPRKPWSALGEVERWSWERNPTPRHVKPSGDRPRR